MLAICAAHLSPQGVAFFSYNAYPGFHLRAMVREMLRYQIEGIADPNEAIQQAYWLMQFLMDAQDGEDEYGACLRNELGKTLERPPGGLFHDDLAEGTTAFYFHEVAAMAREHGLQYLAEAEFFIDAGPGVGRQSGRGAAAVRGRRDPQGAISRFHPRPAVPADAVLPR